MVGGLASSGSAIGRYLALIRPCLGLFPFRAHVPFFQISYYSIAITLVFGVIALFFGVTTRFGVISRGVVIRSAYNTIGSYHYTTCLNEP